MIDAEHRRPLAAFLVVCAAGFVITGFGLRTQVVQVLVDNGAPAALVGVVAPDVMLGETLSSKPAPPAAAAPSTAVESTGAGGSGDQPTASTPTEVAVPPASNAGTAAEPAHSRPRAHSKPKGAATEANAATPVAVTVPAPQAGKPTAPVTTVPPAAQPSTGKPAPTPGAKPAAPIVRPPVRAEIRPVFVPGPSRSHGDGHVRGDRGHQRDHVNRHDRPRQVHVNRQDRPDRQDHAYRHDRGRHSSVSKTRRHPSLLVGATRSDGPSRDRSPSQHGSPRHAQHDDGSQGRSRHGQRSHDRGHASDGHGPRSRH